ncbi:MAG: hypothetical protein NUV63_00955 [Gallionella sp.]|nr:hypothetical protein [Gallionella sp.]
MTELLQQDLNSARCLSTTLHQADWPTIITRSMVWRALLNFIFQQHDGQALKHIPALTTVVFEKMEQDRYFRSSLENKQQVGEKQQ